MATYKKRGYKPKSEKEQEDINEDEKAYVEGESNKLISHTFSVPTGTPIN